MKQVCLFTLLIMLCMHLGAQERPKFGAKAGLNISSVNSSGDDLGSKAGLHAGFLAHIHLSPEWGIQPELLYSNQGGEYNAGNTEHRLNLNYINIPLQLQYMFNNGFRLQTGPQLGLLIDVTDKVNGNETNDLTSDDFKTVDFSWSFGLGYLMYSGFGIDGRYNLGISDINDFGGNKLRNSVFQLGLFYLFDHKHKARSR